MLSSFTSYFNFFFFNDTATTEIYTLSLHDALPISIVEFARKENIVVLAGALTPTEVTSAWKAGADFVKIFPCSQVGGDSYNRALKGPFPQVPLISPGGLNHRPAANFILPRPPPISA